jgi:hypothetical protein
MQPTKSFVIPSAIVVLLVIILFRLIRFAVRRMRNQ